MERIAEPLRRMGAEVTGRQREGSILPPLQIVGGRLRPIRYRQKVASAQVKSAILLAAWVGGVPAEVTESPRSRDHTERMMKALGEEIRRIPHGVALAPRGLLRPPAGEVPGDPSAGAFFAAAAAALPGSDLTLEGVCLNPTRLGFYRGISRMGARVEKEVRGTWCGEPIGDLRVRPGKLTGIRLVRSAIPSLVDEIPVLAVLAAGAARGTTRITGAEELRVKESDRIRSMATGLAALGIKLEERPDGLVLEGGRLMGGTVDAWGDHRIAMAFRIAGLLSHGVVRVRGAAAMRVSHAGFDRALRRLTRRPSG
jgi:3-phosphoshikimate 1-carboxyvinyltransferase